jgi:hypothetical protein
MKSLLVVGLLGLFVAVVVVLPLHDKEEIAVLDREFKNIGDEDLSVASFNVRLDAYIEGLVVLCSSFFHCDDR